MSETDTCARAVVDRATSASGRVPQRRCVTCLERPLAVKTAAPHASVVSNAIERDDVEAIMIGLLNAKGRLDDTPRYLYDEDDGEEEEDSA